MRALSRPVALLAVLVFPLAAKAETYHVSPQGDDAAAGSDQAPWRTLQHAADAVEPGDTVVVHAGNYQGFDLRIAGTEAAPITFQAEPGAVIDEPNASTGDGINVEEVSYVNLEGFTIVPASAGGVRNGIRAALCDHVAIRRSRIEGAAERGILTGFCDDLWIEDNECAGSLDEHGIYVSNSGDRPTIRRNLLHHNNGAGIHMNGDVSMGGDGVISEALVEANVAFENGVAGASGINCDGVRNSIFRNNLLYLNHASGISLYQIDGGEPSSNNLLINNTVVMADNARWALNIQDAATGNRVYNNILYNYHPSRGSIDICPECLDGFESDFNVLMDRMTSDDSASIQSLAEWQASSAQDAHSLVAGPAELFADAAGQDYHLSAASPAIDVGTATDAPSVDLDDNGRPIGAAVDIGAYEYCAEGDCAAAGAAGSAGAGGAGGAPGDGGSEAASGGAAGTPSDADVQGDVGTTSNPVQGASDEESGCGCRVMNNSRWSAIHGLGLLGILVAVARLLRRGGPAGGITRTST